MDHEWQQKLGEIVTLKSWKRTICVSPLVSMPICSLWVVFVFLDTADIFEPTCKNVENLFKCLIKHYEVTPKSE